jgi:hypothetical protein
MNRGAMFLAPDYSPNTFIGGVGATSVTSKADWAAITDLTEDEIKNFVIDGGNNVSFFVDVDYLLADGSNCLYNDPDVTYFLDIDGHITGATGVPIGVISGALIKYIHLPNFGSVSGRQIAANVPALRRANIAFNSPSFISTRVFYNSNFQERIYLPNITAFNQNNNSFYSFDRMTNVKRIYIPLADSTSSFVYNGVVDIASICHFYQNTGNAKVYYNDSLGLGNTARLAFMNFSVNASMPDGTTFIFNGLTYTAVSGAPSTDGEFQNDVANNGIRVANICAALNNDTRVGTIDPKPFTSYRTNLGHIIANQTGQVFADLITWDFTPNPNASCSISNIGADDTGFIGGDDVHPMLMYLRDELGCTLIPITIITTPAPSSLSFINLAANSVDLTFTEPTPNANGTDVYEVWIDDGTLWRKLFWYAEIVGTGSTLDITEVVNDIGSGKDFKVKVRTMDNHMNFSDFSNEIIITTL